MADLQDQEDIPPAPSTSASDQYALSTSCTSITPQQPEEEDEELIRLRKKTEELLAAHNAHGEQDAMEKHARNLRYRLSLSGACFVVAQPVDCPCCAAGSHGDEVVENTEIEQHVTNEEEYFDDDDGFDDYADDWESHHGPKLMGGGGGGGFAKAKKMKSAAAQPKTVRHTKLAKLERPGQRRNENLMARKAKVVRNAGEAVRRPPKAKNTLGLDQSVFDRLMLLQEREISAEDYELLLNLDETVKPHTVDKRKLRLFPTYVVGGQDENGDTVVTSGNCAVCIEPLQTGEQVRRLPCGHCFHVSCIDAWLGNSSVNCPVDNLPVPQ